MRFDDNIYFVTNGAIDYDASLNAVQKTVEHFLGKCIIGVNKTSSTVKTNDGVAFVYSLQVIVYRALFDVALGDSVRVVSRDKTYDVTAKIIAIDRKKRYTTLWL